MHMIARLSAVALALSVLSTGAHAASLRPYFPGRLYVTVQASNAIEIFPEQTLWRGLRAAHYDDISPNGRLLLVTSAMPGQVYILNAHTGKHLAKIALGKATQGVKITPDSRTALVVEPGAGAVAVIDLKRMKLIKTIPVGAVPHNVRFTHNGDKAYVTLQKTGGVAVINMRTLTRTGEIPLPGLQGPHNLDLADHDRRLWVRDLNDHAAVVDLRTGKVLKYIQVGKGHGGLDVIPGGRYVFVGAIADKVVDAIDTRTLKVVREIPVGIGPHGVRASRDGKWVYAEVTGTSRLAVINTRTLKVVRQIPIKGKFPFWGAVRGNE